MSGNSYYSNLEGNHMHRYACIRLKHKGYRYCFYSIMHNLKLNICMIAKLTFLEGVV